MIAVTTRYVKIRVGTKQGIFEVAIQSKNRSSITSFRKSEAIEACPEALMEIQRSALRTGFLLPMVVGMT
jgi:hypothetical protein